MTGDASGEGVKGRRGITRNRGRGRMDDGWMGERRGRERRAATITNQLLQFGLLYPGP